MSVKLTQRTPRYLSECELSICFQKVVFTQDIFHYFWTTEVNKQETK